MVSTPLGKVSLTPKGTYNASISYKALDVIQYLGSGYIVLKDCKGVPPPNNTYYMLLVSKGDQGEKGEKGDAQYVFEINNNGHLLVYYTGDDAPEFSLEPDGHLYLNIEED